MIRRVAFRKAILAGIAGAVAWEVAARGLILLGAHILDITRTLGTMLLGEVGPELWWPLGLVMHAAFGVLWAIFYAYFFWSELKLRPYQQGLLFAAIPVLLAGFVMVPQLGNMHPLVISGQEPHPSTLGLGLGWGGLLAIVLGHAIYGFVLGTLYTHPAGYRVGAVPKEYRRAS